MKLQLLMPPSKMRTPSVMLAGVLLASAAPAQDTTGVRFEGERPANRFGLSYRAGFNISAKFKSPGGFPAGADPGPARSGVNHNYEDGYNRVDSSGNTGQGSCTDCTWNWGYNRAGQINGQFLSLSSTSREGEADADDEISHGAELSYQRELGQIGRAYWGVEGAVNYMTLGLEGDLGASRITDRYALNGVVPPLPPYEGNFQGPGPVISDIPIRSVSQLPSSSRELDADIYGFKVGPYIEWPFAEKWSLLFSGGLAVASINTDFKLTDGVTGVSDSDSDSDWNFGAYVSGNIIYNITPAIDVFAGAQYQFLGDYTHEFGVHEAELDLGDTVFGVIGMGFSF